CSMNLDQFDSLKEARRFAWHLAWQAIDAQNYHSNPAHRSGSRTEVIIRKRNALEMASANLHADAFSAIVAALHNDREAVGRMAYLRSMHSVSPRSLQSPEFYPFALAAESAKFSLGHAKTDQ